MKNLRVRLNRPLKVALLFAALGVSLALVGIARGLVPLHPLSILLAIILSGGVWGIVSWAVATAAADSEQDTHESN